MKTLHQKFQSDLNGLKIAMDMHTHLDKMEDVEYSITFHSFVLHKRSQHLRELVEVKMAMIDHIVNVACTPMGSLSGSLSLLVAIELDPYQSKVNSFFSSHVDSKCFQPSTLLSRFKYFST